MPLLPREDPNASVWNYCPLDATMHAPRDADMRAAMLARHWLAVRLMEDPAQRSEVIQMPRAVADALAHEPTMVRLYDGYEAAAGRQGVVAGFVLIYLLVMSRDSSIKSSLNKALHLAAEQAKLAKRWGDGVPIAQTTRQVRKYWDEFKSVSHLWAARSLVGFNYSTGRDSNFTYETHVVELIEWAEVLRCWLESFVPDRATEPLVKPLEMWRPPGNYRLDNWQLKPDMSAIPAGMAAWLSSYKTPTSKYYD